MILKKPYAFLIKNFKILHLVLAGLMIYFSIRINLITNLFDKLANNISISVNGLETKYINGFMYLSLVLIIVFAFGIWFLMKNKNKPTKLYIGVMIYYVMMFIFLTIFASVISTIEEVSITNQSLRAYRDVSFLFPIGQYYFIIMSILRGIGFNMKQFNFSKDIKELEISEEDSEEIEINLSSKAYKYKRFGRKRLREFKYYFFENKYWILIILGIVLIVGVIYFFINYKFINNNFRQGAYVNANNYNFSVKNVYVTKYDVYGEIIKNDKKYIIVNINIRNNFYESRALVLKNFILEIGKDYFYPISNKNKDFKDLGLPYDNKYLDNKNEYNYILIYEIDDKMSINNLTLKVYDKIDYESNKAEFANIKLKPIKLDKIIKENKVHYNEKIIFDKFSFGNTELKILNYDLIHNYEYNYELCITDECSEKTNVIMPNDILNNKLLVINYELLYDKESNLYTFITNDQKFFNTFVVVSYNINEINKNIKFNGITNVNIKNKIFLEVPKEIEEAKNISIIINTRDNKYILN